MDARYTTRDTRPLDEHVGGRIRLARMLRGLTQTQLARPLGITFQQLQKYEWGANRVGAGRLFVLAGILGLPLSYFFDDMPAGLGNGKPRPLRHVRGDLELMRLMDAIDDPAHRKAVVNLARTLAEVQPRGYAGVTARAAE